MKKIASLLLICILTLSLIGCTKEEEYEKPVDVLTKTWNSYKKNEKFHVVGGDFDNQVEEAPGIFNVEDKEVLKAMLIVPEDASTKIADAASMIHAMNANTFTTAAYMLNEKKDLTPFVRVMEDAIKNNQWMCGFPEYLTITKIDDKNVVITFGSKDLVKTFEKKIKDQYKDSQLLIGVNLE